MGEDYKREARRQYFRYFRIWFIAVGILAVLCMFLAGRRFVDSRRARANDEAPAERVYDYADVLTDEEEEGLRRHIAEKEKELHIDFVLVTFSRSVEGLEAKEQYGYDSTMWEINMRDIADAFWEEKKYGYNEVIDGDGVLLLHNWYEGQNGEHLLTNGRVEKKFGYEDIDTVLYAVDDYYATDPYRAYMAYIDTVGMLLEKRAGLPFFGLGAVVVSLVVALIYAAAHLMQKPAANTTAVNAYVVGGKPEMNSKSDEFIRKSVVTRRIQTSSSGGRSGGHSGGGGHHVSSGGHSHGGGSHRH